MKGNVSFLTTRTTWYFGLLAYIYSPAATELSPEKPIGSRPSGQVLPPAGPPLPFSGLIFSRLLGKRSQQEPSEQVLLMTHTYGFISFNLKHSEPATPPTPNLFAFFQFLSMSIGRPRK